MLLLAFSLSSAVHAGPEASPFRATSPGLTLAPLATGPATVIITVPPGTTLYKDMTELTVVEPAGLTVGEVSLPPAIEKEDPALGLMRELWDMDVYIELPVTAPATPGDHEVVVEATWQGCKGTLCFMPVTEQVTVPVRVEAPKAAVDE
ncbi:MAG: hypothetical protein GY884_27435 [Proteobacteria bacterium]|nr:hypothetical protein [Pseudomonadota bacterium]